MSDEIRKGQRVRIRDGVPAPDLPEFSIAGWSGTVTEISGKKGQRKYFVEWDESTLQQMTPDFLKSCENRQLYHLMVCLTADDLEELE